MECLVNRVGVHLTVNFKDAIKYIGLNNSLEDGEDEPEESHWTPLALPCVDDGEQF
jgi:hypothetical protein